MIQLVAKFDKLQDKISALARQLQELAPVARDFGGHVVARIKQEMTSQDEPSKPGEPPASHHGGRGLRGSATYNVLPDNEGVEIGTPMEYGGILHLGGTIRPKTARALTIPIADMAKGKRARDFEGLFLVKAKPGADPEAVGVLAIREGEGILPLFALRSAVTIEPRPWLEIVEPDEKYLADALERALDRQVFGVA